MDLLKHKFRGHSDVLAIHALISDCWQKSGPHVAYHVGDLHWRICPRPGRHPEQDLCLFVENDRLRGFAWLDSPDGGEILCHPEAKRARLEPLLLSWLEEESLARGRSHLSVGCLTSDHERVRVLQSRGYQRKSEFYTHMSVALDPPSGSPDLPPQYALDRLRPSDLASLARTISLTFGTKPKPESTYVAMCAGEFYRDDLGLVIRSPEGEIAAFGVAWLDEPNHAGLLEPVGCHPDHRRQGLARAVVIALLRALVAAGARTAVVYPNGQNAAAVALYEACGFTTVDDDYSWQLALGCGAVADFRATGA
jgi:ribosomal protein S18 acetylase RimI-like enzyme